MLIAFAVVVLIIIVYLIQTHKYANKDETYCSNAVFFAKKSLERQNIYEFSEDLTALSKRIIQTTLNEKKALFSGKFCTRPHVIVILMYSFAQELSRIYEQKTAVFYLVMAAYLENLGELQRNGVNYRLSEFELALIEEAVEIVNPILKNIHDSPLTKEIDMILNNKF